MNKIQYIDRIKGMAILLMVLGHIYVFCYDYTQTTIFVIIQRTNMPLFMFLSGFVIITPPDNRKIVNRIIRYMLPSVIIGFFLDIYNKGTCSFEDVVNHLIIPSTGFWYLVVLTIFNISLMTHRLNKKNSVYYDALISVCFYIFFTMMWRYGGKIGDAFCMEHCTCFYPFFIIGFLSRKYGWDLIMLRKNYILTFAVCGYILLLKSSFGIHLIDNLAQRLILPVLGIAVVVYIFAHREDKMSKVDGFLSFFGRNSLNIYLFHFFILPFIHLHTLMDWFLETNNLFLEIIVSTIICFLVSLCAVYIGKFITLSDFARNYIYGNFINSLKK